MVAAAASACDGLRTERIADSVAVIWPRFQGTFLNQVIGLGLKQRADAGVIRDITAVYRQEEVDRFGVGLSPVADPADDIPGWLAENAILPVNQASKMYRRSRAPAVVATDLRIEVIGERHAAAFAALALNVFEMPEFSLPVFEASIGRAGWRHYLAFDGDLPVATGMVFLRNGIAWLGAGATLPTHRRRGAQGAIMARRINDSLAAGCKWIIVETTAETPGNPNSSYHNMLRTGFELAYHRQDYIWRGSGVS